jgi:hypothetical protein
VTDAGKQDAKRTDQQPRLGPSSGQVNLVRWVPLGTCDIDAALERLLEVAEDPGRGGLRQSQSSSGEIDSGPPRGGRDGQIRQAARRDTGGLQERGRCSG